MESPIVEPHTETKEVSEIHNFDMNNNPARKIDKKIIINTDNIGTGKIDNGTTLTMDKPMTGKTKDMIVTIQILIDETTVGDTLIQVNPIETL